MGRLAGREEEGFGRLAGPQEWAAAAKAKLQGLLPGPIMDHGSEGKEGLSAEGA